MKRLFLFCAVVLMAAASYAACNQYGWKNKGEMFLALQNDCNDSITAAGKSALNVVKEQNDSVFYLVNDAWLYWEDVENAHTAISFAGDWSAYTYGKHLQIYSVLQTPKWSWLLNYMKANYVAGRGGDESTWDPTYGPILRCNVEAFFFSAPTYKGGDMNPWSFDYTTAGAYSVFQPYWGEELCLDVVKVNYDLQGGKTNDYGWVNGEDMYQALAADVYAAKQNGTCAGFAFSSDFAGTFGAPSVAGASGIALDIVTFDLTFWTTEPYASKWGWLANYLEATSTAAGQANNAKTNSAYARYSLAAFFQNSFRSSWPASADLTNAGVGNIAMWQSYWNNAWANPTEFAADTVIKLNDALKEGETFRGWYLDAQGNGEKIDSLRATLHGATLYATFGEYVYNMQEVWDIYAGMQAGDTTYLKTTGIVTYVNGGQFYIQDDFGGMLCYTKNHGLHAGEKADIKGALIVYNGAPEICNITKIDSLADGLDVYVPSVTVNDIALTRTGYLFSKINFASLKLANAEDKYLYFSEGKDTLVYYNASVLASNYTVNKRYSVSLILGQYKGSLQLVGDPAGVTPLTTTVVENNNYDEKTIEGVHYNFANQWLYSMKEGNFTANRIGSGTEQSRGMVVKNGKMYFTWRLNNSPAIAPRLYVVNAEGDMEDYVEMAPEVFRQYEVTAEGDTLVGTFATSGDYVFGPMTDLAIDEAGHLITANLPTEGHVFQVWNVDETTGAGNCIIFQGGNSGNPDLHDQFAVMDPETGTMTNSLRIDRINVTGDITKDATIYAVIAAENAADAKYVYSYDIKNGAWDGKTYQTALEMPEGVDGLGATPQICPVGDGYFWVDGFHSMPMLYDEDGLYQGGFYGDNIMLIQNEEGTDLAGTSPAGVYEFEYKGEYYFLMGAAAEEGAGSSIAPQSCMLFKYADENKEISEMTRLWQFPAQGCGNEKNPQRVVDFGVKEENEGMAIYFYVAENGYGKYLLSNDKVSLPDNLWIIGNCATAEWLPGASKQMTKTAEGVFEVEETLTGTWFAFVSSIDNCTATTTDWDVINSHRYGSNPSGENISDGAVHSISGVNGDYSFTVSEAGAYKFVVNLNDMTVTATPASALEDVQSTKVVKTVEDGQVVILKNGVKYNVLGAVVK